MKIYLAHSRHSFDYENELYKPLRASALNTKHEIILPHEKTADAVTSKEVIKTCDLVLAEVSYPATGVGIELGWADAFGKPILCVYKAGNEIPSSLRFITKDFIVYSDSGDLISQLDEFLKNKVV